MCKIIVVLAAGLLLLLAALPASASAELSGWQYQQEIAIQENSGETLHDYQVLVALSGSDFPGEAQSDGDDIRFTDADGTSLSYWIEEFDAGSDHTLLLPITVRAEAKNGPVTGTSESEGSSTPGFAAVVAIIGLLLAYRRKGA